MKDEQGKRTRPYLQYSLLGLFLVMLWSLQSAPDSLFTLSLLRPVPVVVFVVTVGIVYGEMVGGAFGLFAGMLMDLYTTPSVAFHAVLLTALGIFCGLAVKHWLMNNLLTMVVLWFVGSLIYFVLYWLLFKVILGDDGWLYLYRFALPGGLYTGAWGVVVAPIVAWIRRC